MGLIYKIVNNINGDEYVGQTKKSLNERVNQHYYNSDYGFEYSINDAIRTYGREKQDQ